MYYKNGRIVNTLPHSLEFDGKVIFNPKWHHYEAAGWKELPASLRDLPRSHIKWVDGDPVELSQEEKDILSEKQASQAKESLINAIIDRYAEVERLNLTPAGAVQLKEWCDMDMPMAQANKAWFQTHYEERLQKLLQVEADDLSVDPEPSSLWKPHSFKEIMLWIVESLDVKE